MQGAARMIGKGIGGESVGVVVLRSGAAVHNFSYADKWYGQRGVVVEEYFYRQRRRLSG